MRESDAMTGTPVALDGAIFITLDFDATQFFPGADVADFEPEQLIYIDESQRVRSVDGEGANNVVERSNGFDDLVRFGVSDAQERRPEAGEIDSGAIGSPDGVVGAGFGA